MVRGISHITICVKNMARTAALLKEVLGAQEVYRSRDWSLSIFPEIFLLVGNVWIAVRESESVMLPRTGNHLAFQIDDSQFAEFERRLLAAGVELVPAMRRFEGERRSLYFYDYDNHLFELHTGTLGQRLANYAQAAG